MDPAAFGDPDAFAAAVYDTLGTLKGLPVAEGADGVFSPGERSAAVAEEQGGRGFRWRRRYGGN